MSGWGGKELGEALNAGEVRSLPQLRSPQLKEVGVALDFLDHLCASLASVLADGLLKWPGEGGQGLVGASESMSSPRKSRSL